ncbi:MAG: hypothetical protein M1472_05015 [Planctomycetes bacterium]|nr:hypothetical protein [Planctomycetota bacterium]
MPAVNRCINADDPTGCARFAPTQLIAPVAGMLLLLATSFKMYQHLRWPVHPSGLQRLPAFEEVLISLECFLGLWLISGAVPIAARRVAVGCFSLFACYTLFEALAGKADCGCFGQVHVSPWFTFVLDVAIVLALMFFARLSGKDAYPSRWSKRKWPVAAAAGIGLLMGVGSAVFRPYPIAAANGLVTANSGKIVILEPNKWIDRRLPVLANIVQSQPVTGMVQPTGDHLQNADATGVSGQHEIYLSTPLSHGRWIVMFYHASCDECRATIPIYEGLAQQQETSGQKPHVAFVRVPSGSESSVPHNLFHSNIPLHATLDSSHQWFAQTPAVVELNNGVVVRGVSGAAAMNLNWLGLAGGENDGTATLRP